MRGNQVTSLLRPRHDPEMPAHRVKMALLKNILLFLVLMFLLCVLSEAREFVVDGENNLRAVPSSVDKFNKWAEKTRFQIGDSLVLKYDSKTDSVLEVTEEDYKISNNANSKKSYHDVETKILLEKSGCVSIAARMFPELGQHTMPTNCLEMPENQAASLPIQEASRTWPVHRPLETARNYLKIGLYPCHAPDAYRI
ncbi:early nodulin 1 [Olea europaea subsp. europaea]|uniref:Early nodulin 1 n=1 Tax=Olea europaea subsp. europaea TaxID=158383 RepID=A0A8S0PPF3_OLEEU|nr:early nodulin 1 [Olea europaea subsp. europaea]